jgi:hypothetical protein
VSLGGSSFWHPSAPHHYTQVVGVGWGQTKPPPNRPRVPNLYGSPRLGLIEVFHVVRKQLWYNKYLFWFVTNTPERVEICQWRRGTCKTPTCVSWIGLWLDTHTPGFEN